jgi:hypothetical protein
MTGQIHDSVLAQGEVPQDHQSGRITETAEQTGGDRETVSLTPGGIVHAL